MSDTAEPRTDVRAALIAAFLDLLAEQDFRDITLQMIAERAGSTLGDLRRHANGKLDLIGQFARDVDAKVLDGADAAMADEPARERLFDVLMRRFDVLQPHRTAVKSLDRALREDPSLGLALFPVAMRSQRWMLSAAGIEPEGLNREIAVRGLVIAFGRAARVWLEDEDPGLARTMAELDKRLREGETIMRRLDDVSRLTAPLRAVARGLMRAASSRSRRSEAHEPGPAMAD